MLPFAMAVVLGATLLFMVQPMIGKHLLPWFGGTAAVWTACMLFFQTVLLLGYAYVHALSWLRPTRQAWLHLGLLAAALGQLAWQAWDWQAPGLAPYGPGSGAVDAPALRVLGLAAVSVGLPYLLLSASSPLLQSWFHLARPGQSPYGLYALSNAGSLLGLLAYPFLLEPWLGLRAQAWTWSFGFAAYALALVVTAVLASRAGPAAAARSEPAASTPRPRAGTWALWVLLPAAASVVLLAATQQLTQDVAPVPFLWVLPLSLYLLTFILTFSSRGLYRRRLFMPALGLGLLLVGAVLWFSSEARVTAQISILSGVVFVCGMVCHGELYRLKPPPERLTGFYLALSLGGALGGLFVGLFAPLVFSGNLELHIGLALTLVLAGLALWRDGAWRKRRLGLPAGLGSAALICVLLGPLVADALRTRADAVFTARDFYGTLQVHVQDAGDPRARRHDMVHGRIVHGIQFIHPDLRRKPTAYFGEHSGAGLIFRLHPRRLDGEPLRIGVIGLGIGTLAAYGQPGDTIRFFELVPRVASLAWGEGGFFSYLGDSLARVEVVLGDARLALERELATGPARTYDVIVVDAFSSDAVPVHLLTREALDLYRAHLAPDGLLAMQVTNRHLELAPLVMAYAEEVGWPSAWVLDRGDGEFTTGSRWVLLGQAGAFWDNPEVVQARVRHPNPRPGLRPWSDDFSNLFEVLR